jgi:hypothetical protein
MTSYAHFHMFPLDKIISFINYSSFSILKLILYNLWSLPISLFSIPIKWMNTEWKEQLYWSSIRNDTHLQIRISKLIIVKVKTHKIAANINRQIFVFSFVSLYCTNVIIYVIKIRKILFLKRKKNCSGNPGNKKNKSLNLNHM